MNLLEGVDEARVGRAISTGRYELTVAELAELVVVASIAPPDAVVERTWRELIVIDRPLAELTFARARDAGADTRTVVLLAHLLTNPRKDHQ